MARDWPQTVGELVFEQVLGKGFFAEVWLCRIRGDANRLRVALKKIPLSLIRQRKMDAQMEREITILKRLEHPYIMKLHFSFRDSSHVYLGLQFAEGGGMFNRLSKLDKFAPAASAQYFYEICDALEYMHGLQEKVIHRDIKPENILFDADGHVQLADFGWSNMLQGLDSRTTFCGTPDYIAPEMIRGEGYNESLDMWCMGVLLYEMLSGKSPFGASNAQKTYKKIMRCELRFPSDMNLDAKDCIKNLCKIAPGERLTAKQAKVTSFVIKHHEVADERFHERPSVTTRRLRQDKWILESEISSVLECKRKLEQQMFEMTNVLEGIYAQLQQERTRIEAAEAKLSRLREEEVRQGHKVEELRARGDLSARIMHGDAFLQTASCTLEHTSASEPFDRTSTSYPLDRLNASYPLDRPRHF